MPVSSQLLPKQKFRKRGWTSKIIALSAFWSKERGFFNRISGREKFLFQVTQKCVHPSPDEFGCDANSSSLPDTTSLFSKFTVSVQWTVRDRPKLQNRRTYIYWGPKYLLEYPIQWSFSIPRSWVVKAKLSKKKRVWMLQLLQIKI